jgi:MSHA type pilus biogenesis protein MshL
MAHGQQGGREREEAHQGCQCLVRAAYDRSNRRGSGVEGGGSGGSSVNLTAQNPVNFWSELQGELEKLVSPRGKDGLAVNMTSGIIQVTDRPSALKRIEHYIKSLDKTIHRQVDIEARLYDVTLSDQFQFGIDWNQVARMYGSGLGVGGAAIPTTPAGGFDMKPDSFTMVFQNQNTKVMVEALQEMGEVQVISKPRIRTMNNQTALIKVGTETPFFANTQTILPGSTGANQGLTTLSQDQVQSITVGTILAITPQVSIDDWVTLDISPVLTSLLEVRKSPSGSTTAPVLDIKQASTLIRVRDGSTIVMGGLIQTSQANTRRKVPVAGDIPVLGKLFTGRFDAAQKRELVMLITPRIVN